jgi:hypothetical protein
MCRRMGRRPRRRDVGRRNIMDLKVGLDKWYDVEVTGKRDTTIAIQETLGNTVIELSVPKDCAGEIMEQICQNINGFYVVDKINELRYENDSLIERVRELEEELEEERRNNR